MKLFILTIILLIFTHFNLAAASVDDTLAKSSSSVDSVKPGGIKFRGFPVAFYSPETRFAGGLVGFFNFRWKGDS
ncbi:MAG: hypothetical protein KJ941_13025, partial [Bacteroidetes bacterium]|nr:hypothetical protein [Bacteroidota bacterium]